MDIEIVLLPEEIQGKDISNYLVVVIDVLRASSTITTALAEGAEKVIPVLLPEEARKKAGNLCSHQVLLAGERGGVKIAGFDLGNSPLEYISPQVKGKNIFLTTTNGTKALNLVSKAAQIIIGCFLNIQAVTYYSQHYGKNILLLCAGDRGHISLEDTVCAGMIKYLMEVSGFNQKINYYFSNDDAQIASFLFQKYKDNLLNMLQTSIWGRKLRTMGFEEDLIFCAQQNRYNIIPEWKGNGLVMTEVREHKND